MKRLPNTLTVCGRSYHVNTDFRFWTATQGYFDSPDLTNSEKAQINLLRVYGEIPHDVEEAFKQIAWFYSCGEERRGEPAKERLLDWDKDFMALWGDFKLYCRVDLMWARMHWWSFYALFRSLPPDAEIKRRTSIRSIDLSQIKDTETRENYRKMKEAVALDDGGYEDLQGFYDRVGL